MKPIGAYRTVEGGWAAYDKAGRAWLVSAEEAAAIAAAPAVSKKGRGRA